MSSDPSASLGLAAVLHAARTNPDLNADPSVLALWPYRRLHNAAVDGKIPADLVGGRWKVRVADLPKLLQVMGATPRPKMGRRPKAKPFSASSSMGAMA